MFNVGAGAGAHLLKADGTPDLRRKEVKSLPKKADGTVDFRNKEARRLFRNPEDSRTLADYDIKTEPTLHLVVCESDDDGGAASALPPPAPVVAALGARALCGSSAEQLKASNLDPDAASMSGTAMALCDQAGGTDPQGT